MLERGPVTLTRDHAGVSIATWKVWKRSTVSQHDLVTIGIRNMSKLERQISAL